MLGFFIGLICGGLALYFMSRVTRALVRGSYIDILLPFFLNILSILMGLLPVAFLLPSELLYCGIGMSASLVLGAFGIFIIRSKESKGRDKIGHE